MPPRQKLDLDRIFGNHILSLDISSDSDDFDDVSIDGEGMRFHLTSHTKPALGYVTNSRLDLPGSSHRAPVVLIHGFMGWGKATYWAQAMHQHDNVIVADCGPGSSLHDRACELFYQLVGGRVDYGEEHSAACGHNRYGRYFDTPAHPSWSAENPIHIIGHSAGGNTARVLQQYLHDKAFASHPKTSANWVRSLSTLSSPHLGTPLSHTLGQVIGEPGVVQSLSFGWFATKAIHTYDYFAHRFLKSAVFDPYLEHWGDNRFTTYLRSMWKSPMFCDSIDNATYDMTPEGARRWNETMSNTFDCTYYFSFTTQSTSKSSWSAYHIPSAFSVLAPVATMLGRSEYSDEDTIAMYGNSHDLNGESIMENMRANDGVVPVLSQAHPHLCSGSGLHMNEYSGKYESCSHARSLKEHLEQNGGTLESGKWHVTALENVDHLGIVVMPRCGVVQTDFFKELYTTLRSLDEIL